MNDIFVRITYAQWMHRGRCPYHTYTDHLRNHTGAMTHWSERCDHCGWILWEAFGGAK